MKYTIEELTNAINFMLERLEQETSIEDIEIETGCKILHKLLPILKKTYVKLPTKISTTETQILIGKLREGELKYRIKIKEEKRGQKKLGDFV